MMCSNCGTEISQVSELEGGNWIHENGFEACTPLTMSEEFEETKYATPSPSHEL